MANYLEDVDLFYEVVLSKGKGYLTTNAEKYFILIAKNTIRKLECRYESQDEMKDCLQHGMLRMFENWQSFDERKFSQALPYFTELAKRGFGAGFNLMREKKYKTDNVRKISIQSSNDGKGLHNI